jgi:multicomponent Na+:H+ antiporter subunit E
MAARHPEQAIVSSRAAGWSGEQERDAVGGAVAASLLLVPPGSGVTMGGLLRFVPYFVVHSLRGGFDVARRALHPRLPIDPGYHDHPLRLPDGAARTFFAALVGLLPGTLGVEIREGRLRVHVLDRKMPTAGTLRELEERVADLFGVEARSGSR